MHKERKKSWLSCLFLLIIGEKIWREIKKNIIWKKTMFKVNPWFKKNLLKWEIWGKKPIKSDMTENIVHVKFMKAQIR